MNESSDDWRMKPLTTINPGKSDFSLYYFMRNFTFRFFLFFTIGLLVCTESFAGKVTYQGFVRDSISGETLPYASVTYRNSPYGTETDLQGHYILETDSAISNRFLVFSYLGYRTKVIDISKRGHHINVTLAPVVQQLGAVVIKATRKEKYKRKGNPAVDLMRRVIAHKDSNDIRKVDYYSVKRYEKNILGLNNVKAPDDSTKLKKGKFNYIYQYIDSSEVSDNTYLPFSIRENISDISYQESPYRLKRTITAQNNKILMNVLSEDMIDNVLSESFADVQLYDNNIDLYLTKFVSPLSVIAPTFYHFFIDDTITGDDGQKYIEMNFIPANTTDMGFTGTMLITTDSSYAVKSVKMNIPRNIKLNIVEKLHIEQEYEKTEEGRYAVSHEKMVSEVFLIDGLQGGYVKRDAYYTGYKWHDIDKTIFDRQENTFTLHTAKAHADTFWNGQRPVKLTTKEASIDSMTHQLKQKVWFNVLEFTLKTCLEGYMTLGKNGYFDYGPVMSTYSHNNLEGSRIRLGGRTNPALNPHWFLDGYGAYGFDDEKLKYKGEVEYSFREKKFSKMDFPRKALQVSYSYDWDIPSERFLGEYNSSFVHSFKREKVTQYAYVRTQQAKYIEEKGSGFSYTLSLKHQEEKAAGDLVYRQVNDSSVVDGLETSTFGIDLGYAPGVRYYQNKTTRYVMNPEIPQFTLSHQTAYKDLLGSQYTYNKTEMSYRQEFFLTPLGYVNVTLQAGKIWDKVPYPLLFIPAANLSYIIQPETFWLMNNMEFLNDQYASTEITYNMDGFLFGRVPLIKKLHWKEVFRFRAMYGSLSDKNNPAKHTDSKDLFAFPQDKNGHSTSYEFGDQPYMEACVGIHNIFKLFRIEYVRRLNYLDNYKAEKWGLCVGMGLYF
jgi:hypothetical protein